MTLAPSPRPVADADALGVDDAASQEQGVSAMREQLGRYILFPPFARGGMATVHLGVNVGPSGFRKVFAVKKLLPGLTEDPQLARALVLEAKLSSFVRSPHVMSTHEVAASGEELGLVMELVDGVTLAKLLACARAAHAQVPLPIVSRILGDVLRGLQAVHDATDEAGRPLQMVHRDVAPKNVLVGRDGLTRIVDFGLAKVVGQKGLTRTGEIKGTLAYMAPEQTEPGRTVTRRTDLYAAGLTAWEMLTGTRYFTDAHGAVGAARAPEPPSRLRGDVPPGLDQLVLRALAIAPNERPATAEEMLIALEANVPPATVEEVARFVERVAWEQLEAMTERIRAALGAPLTPPSVLAPGPGPGAAPASAPANAPTSEEESAPRGAIAPRRRRRWALVGAAGVTGVLFAFALAFSSPNASVNPAPGAASSADRVSSNGSPPVPPAPLPPALAAEVAVDAGQGSSPPVNEVKPGASGKPTSPTVRRPRKERRSEPRRATLCNPPYEYDSEMRKRFKPECVE